MAVIALSAGALAVAALVYLRPPILPESISTSVAHTPGTPAARGERIAFTFLNPTMGWAAASMDSLEHILYVFATEDGARSWRLTATLNVPEATPPFIFRFFDEIHGVLAIGNQGVVFRTLDGGRSWSSVTLPPDAWFPGFADFNDGWTTAEFSGGGPMKIYSTTDGGVTWARLPDLPVQGAVVFATKNDGWLGGATGTHVVYQTTDGGHTWQPRPLPSIACTPFGKRCTSAGVAGVYVELLPGGGLLGEVYDPQAEFISQDGGLTWRAVQPPTATTDYSEISYLDSTHWWAVEDNDLYKTADGGASWTLVTSRLPFVPASPTIIDADHAWVTFGLDEATILMTTADGGRNWVDAAVPIPT